jgi:hypothetical protein
LLNNGYDWSDVELWMSNTLKVAEMSHVNIVLGQSIILYHKKFKISMISIKIISYKSNIMSYDIISLFSLSLFKNFILHY